jgi:hypothetical protein
LIYIKPPIMTSTIPSAASIGRHTRSKGPITVKLNDYTNWRTKLDILRDIKRCDNIAAEKRRKASQPEPESEPETEPQSQSSPNVVDHAMKESDQELDGMLDESMDIPAIIEEAAPAPAPVTVVEVAVQVPLEEMDISQHPAFVALNNDHNNILKIAGAQSRELEMYRSYRDLFSQLRLKLEFQAWTGLARQKLHPYGFNLYQAVSLGIYEHYNDNNKQRSYEVNERHTQEIKKYFRELKQWSHPDKHPERFRALATTTFQWISNVEEILADTRGRMIYNSIIARYYRPLMRNSNLFDPNAQEVLRFYVPHGGIYNTDFEVLNKCVFGKDGVISKVYMPAAQYIAPYDLMEIDKNMKNLYSVVEYNHFA